ncbi:MAG: hemerythrin domain-containing protein [Paracoccaceae bacterium]
MIEDLHYGDEENPEGLSKILRRMLGEMEVHMKKEELILFPAIRKGDMPGNAASIAVLRADHDRHERDITRIRNLSKEFTLP